MTDIFGKHIVFVGATGSIGAYVLEYLLSNGACVTLGARNTEKATRLSNGRARTVHIDLSSIKSIDMFAEEISRGTPPDLFICNAGVFDAAGDGAFAVNAVGCSYLTEKMLPLMNGGRICVTSSISYRFYTGEDYNCNGSSIKKYALSKRALTCDMLYLKARGANITLCHPGVCYTELFEKSRRSKLFAVIKPLMKIVFHSPRDASKSIIYALSADTHCGEWVGPRALFGIRGKPKASRLQKSVCDEKLCAKTHEMLMDEADIRR